MTLARLQLLCSARMRDPTPASCELHASKGASRSHTGQLSFCFMVVADAPKRMCAAVPTWSWWACCGEGYRGQVARGPGPCGTSWGRIQCQAQLSSQGKAMNWKNSTKPAVFPKLRWLGFAKSPLCTRLRHGTTHWQPSMTLVHGLHVSLSSTSSSSTKVAAAQERQHVFYFVILQVWCE